MAPPRAAASSRLLMAATQSRLVANPGMINTHPQYHMATGSAKDEHYA